MSIGYTTTIHPLGKSTWTPLNRLRWLRRKSVYDSVYGSLVLQQMWVCSETGDTRWEDVPTEEE